jgi:GntR family transcriptional regulator
VADHERVDIAQRLAVYLDPGGDVPLYRQIVDRVWLEVVTGTLETGERLPTVRQLAIDLAVHPNTVARAYRELEALGVLMTRPGEGSYVGLAPPDKTELERRAQLERLCRDVVGQCRALGLALDDVIDTLTVLHPDRSDSEATKE